MIEIRQASNGHLTAWYQFELLPLAVSIESSGNHSRVVLSGPASSVKLGEALSDDEETQARAHRPEAVQIALGATREQKRAAYKGLADAIDTSFQASASHIRVNP